MARTILGWVTLLSLLALVSCDMLDPAAETQATQVVVESYQVAGEPLKKVRLTHPSPVDSSYHTRNNGINNAVVQVNLLDKTGAVEKVYPYREAGSSVYVPRDSAIVQPGRTYQLVAKISGTNQVITAETTVPDTFRIVHEPGEILRYESTSDLTFRVTQSDETERDNVYMSTTSRLLPDDRKPINLDLLNKFLGKHLTPAAKKLVDGTESLAGGRSYSPNSLRINEWPPVNGSSYEHHADGTLTIAIPWKNISFFGPTRITTRVIDRNWYDFVRSHAAQQGSGSPAEIPNVIDHVENGTGLFASFSKVEFEVYVARP